MDQPQGAQKAPEPFALVDTPGHPRLRTRALAKNLNASTAAILTIDATTGLTAKNIRTAADSLQLLLGLRSFQSRLDHFPLLVLLTKTEPNAVLIERAKLTLGREMERRRQAGSSGIGNRVEGLAADQGISRDTKELPTDETEILQAEIWSESPWSWNQEVDLGGVKVDWGMSDGTLGEVYDWMAAHQ